MGWTTYGSNRIQGYAAEKDEIARLCGHETEERTYEPIHLSKVGSTWYAAIKIIPKPGFIETSSRYEPSEDGGYVFAAIFLIKYYEGCFGYKNMEECMGPVEARAPMSLIKKLSQLKDDPTIESIEWAKKWRENCRAYAAIPTYQTGDIIELATPIPLQGGTELKTVRQDSYIRRGRTYKCYKCQDSGGIYRLSKAQLTGSRLITPAAVTGSPVLTEFAARQAQG